MDPRYQEMGTENELAIVLSHYDSRFVYDIVNDQIQRNREGGAAVIATPPNVVAAWEQNFKAIMDQYGAEGSVKIQEVRQETYKEIIDIICQAFNLNFTVADIDIYSAAYNLYDFFVCNLQQNTTKFFSKYIYKERTSIYEGMGLSELKKNKDSSTVYGKRMYKDIKLAVINANITKIIDNICKGMEFDFPSVIGSIVEDRNMSRYLINIVSDKGNFFQQTMVPLVMNNFAEFVTAIRLMIQELAISHDQIIYNAAPDAEIPEDDE